jgi:YHS domain-containing protein
MKKYLFFLLFTGLMLSATSFAQEKTSAAKENKEAVVKGEPVNTICPVSAEDADGEITVDYKGTTYALCCKSCLKKFNADPEKYISRLSEDGKSIKKRR